MSLTGRQFSILKETSILVGSQLIWRCSLYLQLMDWCDYFILLLINQTANLLSSTSLFKQMILQIIRGIQKPNTEKFLSRWRALLKTLKVALFVMLIYGWIMFLVKRVRILWRNRASQVKPDQVKNILILKFGCHGHFTLFYSARKKLEFKFVLWASNSHLSLASGAMAICCMS